MYKSSHPYLFRLLNHFETEGHVFLIFEPFEGDSLDHIIQQGEWTKHKSTQQHGQHTL